MVPEPPTDPEIPRVTGDKPARHARKTTSRRTYTRKTTTTSPPPPPTGSTVHATVEPPETSAVPSATTVETVGVPPSTPTVTSATPPLPSDEVLSPLAATPDSVDQTTPVYNDLVTEFTSRGLSTLEDPYWD
jgi:hypothetical protein